MVKRNHDLFIIGIKVVILFLNWVQKLNLVAVLEPHGSDCIYWPHSFPHGLNLLFSGFLAWSKVLDFLNDMVLSGEPLGNGILS